MSAWPQPTRCFFLDTETTGLDPEDGHRIIEIAIVEARSGMSTGREFHRFIHPHRDIPAEASRIHGLTLEALRGKPGFAEIVPDLLAFIGDAAPATLIAHHASFDRRFLEAELRKAGRAVPAAWTWQDSLELARKRFPGAAGNLDALARRLGIANARKQIDGQHSALIDARLLAEIYVELAGGRQQRLDLVMSDRAASPADRRRQRTPRVFNPSDAERAAHRSFLERSIPQAIWLR